MSRRLLTTMMLIGALGLATTASGALTIYLPETATYRYVNAGPTTTVGSVPANWYTPGFDDTLWFVGAGPFGNGFGGNLGNAAGPDTPDDPGHPMGTAWAVNYDPYLRVKFNLPAPTALTLWLAVDNGVNGFFLNGVQATAAVNAEGAAFRWEHVFDIPASYTFAGVNTLALQLEDHGGATGFALVVTEDDATTRPVFSTNDPPDPPVNDPPTNGVAPEPLTAGLSLLGLGALGGMGRRRQRA